jgi:sugar lactone lactonase YvrE
MSTDPRLETVAEGLSYLEGPRWHDGRLFASDFYNHRVLAFQSDGKYETVIEVPNQPSGLGWLPDGRMLVVSMKDRRVMRLEEGSPGYGVSPGSPGYGVSPGSLVEHADLSGFATGHCNDMVVDTSGRAYVGNFGFDLMGGGDRADAVLVRVDPDGTTTVVAEEIMFPNGSVITPDGGTLILAETLGQRLTAFAIDGDGSLSNRRVWAAFGDPVTATDFGGVFAQMKVAPDGICLDAEGAVWFADALGNRVVRVKEGGEITDEISGGELGIFACMLGGDDGRTLFLCASPSFVEAVASADHQARLLACRVDVPHAGLP